MSLSGMLRRMLLVRTEVSEECSATIIRVTIIGELGTTLAVTSNRLLHNLSYKSITAQRPGRRHSSHIGLLGRVTRPVARPPRAQENTEKTRGNVSMSGTGFKPTIPVFELSKLYPVLENSTRYWTG
jgi:hypothetical protein